LVAFGSFGCEFATTTDRLLPIFIGVIEVRAVDADSDSTGKEGDAGGDDEATQSLPSQRFDEVADEEEDNEEGEVKDPYGGTLVDYEECYNELLRLIKKTIYKLDEMGK